VNESNPEIANSVFELADSLTENLTSVIYGAQSAIVCTVVAALSGQHLLLEDVPGVGKTMLAKALAKSLGVDVARIQGQPDLLPSDITGVSVYDEKLKEWEFKPGPVFSHVVLCDELNRTPPRTQAALLEAMEEKQVTVDGKPWLLPIPHMVIATQNPHSQVGTFPLVESQTDRFGLSASLGYPSQEDEISLAVSIGTEYALSSLQTVSSPTHWLQVQKAVAEIKVSEAVAGFAVKICRATRVLPKVSLGASPRAAISLMKSARAHAAMNHRDFVIPDDVISMVPYSLSHRLVSEYQSDKVALVLEALETVEVPSL